MRIELDDVSHCYQAGTHLESLALERVSLSLSPGERLGIAGPTGCGKSTLVEVMAGVLKPSAGRVIHDDVVLGRRQGPVPGRIGLGLQSPENCLFEKTVYDDVAFGPRRLGLAGEELGLRVKQALEGVGLDAQAFSDRVPLSLSTGEQRRVALAGLLAMAPRALLLDEPTAYLDPMMRRDLVGRLLAINEERGTAIAMVSHDMDELALFAQRLVILEEGRIAADGPARVLLKDEELLLGHGLEAPGTVRLCGLLSRCSERSYSAVLDEEEAAEMLATAIAGNGGG
jgi:energy-coupling factor transport system ATP-binding protein